jgi:hypothetical protein
MIFESSSRIETFDSKVRTVTGYREIVCGLPRHSSEVRTLGPWVSVLLGPSMYVHGSCVSVFRVGWHITLRQTTVHEILTVSSTT